MKQGHKISMGTLILRHQGGRKIYI